MNISSLGDGFDGQMRNLFILLLRIGKIDSETRQQMAHLHTYSGQACLEIMPPYPADRLVFTRTLKREIEPNGLQYKPKKYKYDSDMHH